jgi:hypothetical protein
MPVPAVPTHRKAAAALGALVLFLAIPSLLSGCEFGNKSSTELAGFDTISGYYLTLPQSVAFKARIGDAAERTKNGLVAEIPDFLKLVLGNPTLLVFDDPIQGIGSIRSRQATDYGFYTRIDAKNSQFGASEELSATVSGCRFTKTVVTAGSYTQLASQQEISGVKARGSIAVDYQATYATEGDDADCGPMRAKFETCYVSGTGCVAESNSVYNRTLIQEMFDPLIHAGVMTSDEISDAKSVSFRAIYQ